MSFVTSHMGLTAWDQGTDHYDYSQLADNWVDVDAHDHTAGKGVQIPTGGIANAAVTSAKLASNSVNPPTHVISNSITQTQMANNSVGTAQIIDGSVGAAELAAGAITSDKLDPNLLPIGMSILWYRSSGAISVPTGGWEIADGRAWSGITNKMGAGGAQLNTGNMPDSRNKFVLGAATSGTGSGTSTPPDIGQAVGAHTKDLSHTHTMNAHSHSVNGHTHSISADGAHKHRWPTMTWAGDDTPTGSTFTDASQRGSAVPGASGTRQALYVPDLNRNEYFGENIGAPMETVGNHSHGGATGSGTSTTSSTTSTMASAGSSTQDIRPAALGWLILIKVR